ncbi:TIGR01459 family HAD-type hydrolase [Phenylobacterium deserti]|uniref:TIGR01459 family HAD-type hydrolase n=1 Tax=Phenylobacterium deserti TaxID=1914756 RepID=A0A328ARF3_9CAUL|nr:TIGR01459 family HAD-type hydrolase [Phenylobacterium deserti]RAK57622.1 TIGR01459 family HAD-type hydrolase [Phenylobacterium deserti]
MSAPQIVSGLAEIADRYDAVLCDIWGVIHNGRESFRDACVALARFQAERGPVILISNAPRPSPAVIEQLDGLGVQREAYARVVTSGDATRALLAERAPGPAFKLGPDRDDPLYEGTGVTFAPLEEARFIACTGPFDDETEEPNDYRERFEGAVARGLEMICANPDIVVQRGDKLIYCAGALAQLYEILGGKVEMAGKPFRAVYDICLEEAASRTKTPLDRSRVLCIGDGLPTDIRGANAQELDVLFVASGIHEAETLDAGGAIRAEAVESLLRQEGLKANWAMPDLVW